jgi:DNA-binding CsgD family transcriptional regulator
VLGEDEGALALLPGGGVVVLQGPDPDELMARAPQLGRVALERLGPRLPSAAFLQPRPGGGLSSCRAFRCRDAVTLLVVAERCDLFSLTPRELEVLSHLVAGRSNAEIAGELWVTVRTVRAHVERILEKLGVSSRAGAVARAIEEGLVLAA